MVAASETR